MPKLPYLRNGAPDAAAAKVDHIDLGKANTWCSRGGELHCYHTASERTYVDGRESKRVLELKRRCCFCGTWDIHRTTRPHGPHRPR